MKTFNTQAEIADLKRQVDELRGHVAELMEGITLLSDSTKEFSTATAEALSRLHARGQDCCRGCGDRSSGPPPASACFTNVSRSAP